MYKHIIQEAVQLADGSIRYSPFAERLDRIVPGTKRLDIDLGDAPDEACRKLVITSSDGALKCITECSWKELENAMSYCIRGNNRHNTYFCHVLYLISHYIRMTKKSEWKLLIKA